MDSKLLRAVLTLATGKEIYVSMAANLARSFLWWHRESDIEFFLATDFRGPLTADLAKVRRIFLEPGRYGEGFSPKLSLDLIAPAAKTLFIDADCLCVGKLDPVFARFEGRAVSVVGGSISSGEWFGDVATVCGQLGVAALPKFNGGIYYLEPGETANAVFSQARSLEKQYDALGLVRLRGQPNDELLMAMAMAAHHLDAIPDDGTILGDPQACPGPLSLDVINGGSRLINPPAPHPAHQAWYPFAEVAPLVVHFLGNFHESYQYRSAARVLRFTTMHPFARALGRLYVNVAIRFPGWCLAVVKPRLRVVYRRLFGTRVIRANGR